MSDLVAFLTARYDEDEAAAKLNGGWWTVTQTEPGIYAGRQDAKRTLREVEAKRKILAEYVDAATEQDRQISSALDGREMAGDVYLLASETINALAGTLHLVVRLLAAVYSDHDDYRQEWA